MLAPPTPSERGQRPLNGPTAIRALRTPLSGGPLAIPLRTHSNRTACTPPCQEARKQSPSGPAAVGQYTRPLPRGPRPYCGPTPMGARTPVGGPYITAAVVEDPFFLFFPFAL